MLFCNLLMEQRQSGGLIFYPWTSSPFRL